MEVPDDGLAPFGTLALFTEISSSVQTDLTQPL
jgi:hypothetical protein